MPHYLHTQRLKSTIFDIVLIQQFLLHYIYIQYSFLAHCAIPNKLSSGITVTYKSNLPYEQKGLMDEIIAKYFKGNMYGYCMMIIKATTADGIISNCHKAEEINFVNPMYVKLCLRFPKIGRNIQTKIYVYLDHDLK